MTRLKINSSNHYWVDQSKKDFDLSEHFHVAYEKRQVSFKGKHVEFLESNIRTHFLSTSPPKESKADLNYLASGEFDRWCTFVESINIDFAREFSYSIATFKYCKDVQHEFWDGVIEEFIEAVKDYLTQKDELHEEKICEISNESARRFLFLAPLLANRKFHVYIDSNNGCVNVDFGTRDKGVLTTLISDNGHVHYSYVEKNKKIYKLTGTAKFKDSKDFIKFNKVLQML